MLLNTWYILNNSKEYSFGYHRAEIIGALLSLAFIWVLTIGLVIGAIDRLRNPVEINSKVMLGTSIIGVFINIILAFTLHTHDHGHTHSHSHGHEHEHHHEHENEQANKHEHHHEHENEHVNEHEHEDKLKHEDHHKHENKNFNPHKPNQNEASTSEDHGESTATGGESLIEHYKKVK